MYATRNGGISVRQITSCIHSEPNHAYYPVFYGLPRTSTIQNIDKLTFIPGESDKMDLSKFNYCYPR